MLNKLILTILIIIFSSKIESDNLRERPIENRNLYLPFILFLEPYPTTPVTLEKGKFSLDSGMAISNMIDNNNAGTDLGGYSKYKPLFWNNYAEAFSNRSLTPSSYYLSEYINYGRLEQQSHLKMDAEIERFHAKLNYGLWDKFEIGLEVTALSYNTGIFDGPITGYHRAINIPYPLRDIYPNDRFNFSLSDSTKTVIKSKTGTGFGDAVLDGKWQLSSQNGWLPTIAWVNSIKIPTGNTNLYMGSGKVDLSSGISAKWNFDKFFKFINLFGVSPSDSLNSREIHIKPFAAISSTLGYSFTENFSAVTQIEVKGSPYNSGIKMINQTAILWSFGFNWKIFTTCALRANLTEDPITRTVPDVSVQSSLLCMMN